MYMEEVLALWPTGLEYQAPRKIPTVPIPKQGDQPPIYMGDMMDMTVAVQSWVPPDPMPKQSPVVVPVGTQGQQPPLYAGILSDMNTAVRSWDPPDPMPQQRPLEVAPLTLVYGDQPPKITGILSDQNAAIRAWDPPDPMPRQRPPVVPIGTQGQQPTPLADALELEQYVIAWLSPDPMPYRPVQTPPIPPPVINVPPPASTVYENTIVGLWAPPDPMPTQLKRLVPIPAQGDQPPRLNRPQPAWQQDVPYVYPPEQIAAVQPPVVTQVPFLPQPNTILLSWQAGDQPRQRQINVPIPTAGDQPPRVQPSTGSIFQWFVDQQPTQRRVSAPQVPQAQVSQPVFPVQIIQAWQPDNALPQSRIYAPVPTPGQAPQPSSIANLMSLLSTLWDPPAPWRQPMRFFSGVQVLPAPLKGIIISALARSQIVGSDDARDQIIGSDDVRKQIIGGVR
jgi:hypothetical protein